MSFPDNNTQIAVIASQVEEIHHRLFGNGQPGLIREYEERLKSLEKDRVRVIAYIAVVTVLAQMMGNAGWLSAALKSFAK